MRSSSALLAASMFLSGSLAGSPLTGGADPVAGAPVSWPIARPVALVGELSHHEDGYTLSGDLAIPGVPLRFLGELAPAMPALVGQALTLHGWFDPGGDRPGAPSLGFLLLRVSRYEPGWTEGYRRFEGTVRTRGAEVRVASEPVRPSGPFAAALRRLDGVEVEAVAVLVAAPPRPGDDRPTHDIFSIKLRRSLVRAPFTTRRGGTGKTRAPEAIPAPAAIAARAPRYREDLS